LERALGDVTGDCGGFEEIGCILVMAGHSVRVCGGEGEDDADPCFVRDNGGGERRGSANRMGDFRRAPRERAEDVESHREREIRVQSTLCVCEESLPVTCLLRWSALWEGMGGRHKAWGALGLMRVSLAEYETLMIEISWQRVGKISQEQG
jgi:hypothetical protein